MAKGISLHLGLNSVDPSHYDGWDGQLTACEFDAKDMEKIAAKQGFEERKILLTQNVTSHSVTEEIKAAAKKLASGDIFFLTYSGHGGQVNDSNGDEDDTYDETWVFYDRQFVDDELNTLYAQFKPGVRIVVLSDSCHSGSVVRTFPKILPLPLSSKTEELVRYRDIPRAINEATNKKNKATYARIQNDTATTAALIPRATVLLISGCQDNQLSLDGTRNGLFTEKLKKVWNGGKFQYGYRRFRDSISRRMPLDQSPNYLVIGKSNPVFEKQTPFTV